MDKVVEAYKLEAQARQLRLDIIGIQREAYSSMDDLGKRIIEDTAMIEHKNTEADRLEAHARRLRAEAAEIQRLLDLARIWRGS